MISNTLSVVLKRLNCVSDLLMKLFSYLEAIIKSSLFPEDKVWCELKVSADLPTVPGLAGFSLDFAICPWDRTVCPAFFTKLSKIALNFNKDSPAPFCHSSLSPGACSLA